MLQRGRAREEWLHFFNRNKEIAENIVAKAEASRQLRKELQEAKQLARERAKAITLRIPQLKDCKLHFDKKRNKGHGSRFFICEGQSAASSIVSCRTPSRAGFSARSLSAGEVWRAVEEG